MIGLLLFLSWKKFLGILRQTVRSHLEYMVEAGIVVKKMVFNSCPRLVYEIAWNRASDILLALKVVGTNIEELINLLE